MVEPPPGSAPLVLVAPSTAQDPEQRLLRAALRGLADEPVRVLASWNRRPLPGPLPVPANARLVEWVSYAQTMPEAALVVCHAGHGTLMRALTLGRPVVAVPHAGDMPENAARLAWSGAGVRLPWPLLSPRRCGARCGGRSATTGWRSAPRSWRPGRSCTTAPAAPRSSWSDWRAGSPWRRRAKTTSFAARHPGVADTSHIEQVIGQRHAAGPLAAGPRSTRFSADRGSPARDRAPPPRAGGRIRLRPVDDPLRALDHLAVVGDEHRHPVVAGQLLDLAPRRQVVDQAGQRSEPVRAHHLRPVAGLGQRLVGLAARVRVHRLARRPGAVADVELHRRLRRRTGSSGGGTRTHNFPVNSRIFCQLNYPGLWCNDPDYCRTGHAIGCAPG